MLSRAYMYKEKRACNYKLQMGGECAKNRQETINFIACALTP